MARVNTATNAPEAYINGAWSPIQSTQSGQFAGFRNILINGNYAINQRGYVSGTAVGAANTYTLDRWKVLVSGQSLTYVTSGNGNQVTAPAGGLQQVIENVNVGGGTYTLSWTGTATAQVNGSAVVNGGQVTLPANTQATVTFSGGTVSQAQLEPGGVASPFEQRLYGAELVLCQRYFQATFVTSYVSVTTAIGPTNLQWSLPVTMRAAPDVAVLAGQLYSLDSTLRGNMAIANYPFNGTTNNSNKWGVYITDVNLAGTGSYLTAGELLQVAGVFVNMNAEL
jgi:hypothetical protein